ncbi:acetyl-CoA carboxylase biotin carboxyl carrier protein [Saccharomonospora saliphila]|uniref:acetyl-CoA carboxylase biotin carboxyl carrier protein n=1 Tax=Saccharomonospora saliphila TaxID=369829 RepID=UPI00035D671C|nr:biotin/lipoyl-containing protein [Saccharomonospora saliphila]
MTQDTTTNRVGDDAGDGLGGLGGTRDRTDGDVLEQVRNNAVRLLADIPFSPQALRLRAGDVSVEVEWGERGAVAVEAAPGTGAAATSAPGAHDAPEEVRHLTAPAVGVFYRAPEPGAAPFVDVGDSVAVGQQVAIIEAMKLMLPVEAGESGHVVECLKDDGDPVEYGEPLFVLAPALDS